MNGGGPGMGWGVPMRANVEGLSTIVVVQDDAARRLYDL